MNKRVSSNDEEDLNQYDSEIFESFGNIDRFEKENYLAGKCFLKTKTDKFKEHWAVLNGNEVFCFRD
jgi:hypothetical protein